MHHGHICTGHTAWAPEGREGRSQRGPKGRKLEVGARRASKLLVFYLSISSYSPFPADVVPLSPSPRPFLFFIFFIFQINLIIFPLSSSPLTFPQTLSANKWTRALVAGNRASNIPKQPFCQTTLKQKSVKQGIKLNIPKNPGNLEQARKLSLCQTT